MLVLGGRELGPRPLLPLYVLIVRIINVLDRIVLVLLAQEAARGAVTHVVLAVELLRGFRRELLHVVLDRLGQDGDPAGVWLALLLHAHAGCYGIRGFAIRSCRVTSGCDRCIQATSTEDGLAGWGFEEDTELVAGADVAKTGVVAAEVLVRAFAGTHRCFTTSDGHLDKLEHFRTELDLLGQLLAVGSGLLEDRKLLGGKNLCVVHLVPKILGHTCKG